MGEHHRGHHHQQYRDDYEGRFNQHHESDRLESGDHIFLVSRTNGKFMKRYDHIHKHQCITFDNDYPEDVAKLRIRLVGEGNAVTLQADDGKYLKRYDGFKGKEVVVIDHDYPDEFSYFKLHFIGRDIVTLQANNGCYLKRYDGFDGHHVCAILEDRPDEYAEFELIKVDSERHRRHPRRERDY